MNYLKCIFCGTIAPEATFCVACGKALRKWCPRCGDWKAASFTSLEVDDEGSGTPFLEGETQQEAKFCPECGAELQVKKAAHE
jgi:hypothetical protein